MLALSAIQHPSICLDQSASQCRANNMVLRKTSTTAESAEMLNESETALFSECML